MKYVFFKTVSFVPRLWRVVGWVYGRSATAGSMAAVVREVSRVPMAGTAAVDGVDGSNPDLVFKASLGMKYDIFFE